MTVREDFNIIYNVISRKNHDFERFLGKILTFLGKICFKIYLITGRRLSELYDVTNMANIILNLLCDHVK